MTEDVLENNKDSFLIRLANGCVSFVVGLCAFSILKLAFSIPLSVTANMIATTENIQTFEGIGVVLLLVSVYFAVKYTKHLNRSGTRKSRNIKRIITIILGVTSLFLATVLHIAFSK